MAAASTPIIGYHYPCPDGIYAALSAHAHFAALGVAPRFVPLKVNDDAANAAFAATLTPADVLYLLDFSGGAPFLLAAAARAGRVVLLDHHKTAAEDVAAMGAALPAALEARVDQTRAGATIALNFFAPSLPPAIIAAVALVDDNDRWVHALPDSRAFAAGFAALRLELDARKNAGVFAQLLALDTAAVVAAGRAQLAANEARVAGEVARAFLFSAAPPAPPLRCLAVRTRFPDLRSQTGAALADASRARGLDAAGVVAYVEPGVAEGKIKVSVRGGAGFDATLFARHFGGGGHAGAASCLVDAAVFDAGCSEA